MNTDEIAVNETRRNGRRLAWAGLVVLLAAEIGLAGYLWMESRGFASAVLARLGAGQLGAGLVVVAAVFVVALTWLGWRRGWATRQVLGWGYGVLGVVLAGVTAWLFLVLVPRVRIDSKDLAVRSHQIHAAAEQFFLENQDLIFASYDDLIGPRNWVRSDLPVDGEDYHELFPLRRDEAVLSASMGDGRKVIFFFPAEPVSGSRHVALRQRPDGRLIEINRRLRGAGLEAYRRWLAAGQKPDGVHIIELADGRRFEITCRAGVPDGPFRALYADGKLWGEAIYVQGRPVGAHRVYDREGKVTFEAHFPPPVRAQ